MTATLDPLVFRSAMARFAAGVTVVTALDERGAPHGFTASSFCSVSLDPPLVLVCLARSANSYPVFIHSGRFAVSILREQHTDVATRFATKGTDKFDSSMSAATPGGLPAVDGALCVLECAVYDRHDAGDHVVLIGRTQWVHVDDGRPLVHFDRGFRQLSPDR